MEEGRIQKPEHTGEPHCNHHYYSGILLSLSLWFFSHSGFHVIHCDCVGFFCDLVIPLYYFGAWISSLGITQCTMQWEYANESEGIQETLAPLISRRFCMFHNFVSRLIRWIKELGEYKMAMPPTMLHGPECLTMLK